MAGVQIDGVNNKIDFDDDLDTSISANTDDTLVFEIAGATDFTMTANTFTAASGSTIAAQALTATTVTASGIVKTDDTTNATSTTDGSLQTDGGLSVALDAVIGDDLFMKSDAAVIHFGADSEVTMTHVADAGLTITSAGNLHTLQLQSNDADANEGPVLQMFRNSGSPVDDDILGKIKFSGLDGAGNATTYGRIETLIMQEANGSEDATMEFRIMKGGTERNILELDRSEVCINEDSQDIDFRVESDGRTHAFVVDAGTNTTMIGTNQTDFNAGADDLIVGTGSGDKGITIYTGSNAGDKGSIFFADGTGASDIAARRGQISYEHNNELMTFFTNDTEAMRIHLNQVISATAGIALGVGTANTASNVLDDYEEGTWTPTLSGTSGGPSGVNFHSRVGFYTKIGRSVHFHCFVEMQNFSSAPSGTGIVTGLPFTSANVTASYASVSIGYTVNFTATDAPKMGYIDKNSTQIVLKTAASDDARNNTNANVNAGNFSGDEGIMISGHYYV